LRNADAVAASELTEVCVGALVLLADCEVERDVVTNAEYGLLSAAWVGEIELVAIIFSTGGSRYIRIGRPHCTFSPAQNFLHAGPRFSPSTGRFASMTVISSATAPNRTQPRSRRLTPQSSPN
jgi:hypothetical protein